MSTTFALLHTWRTKVDAPGLEELAKRDAFAIVAAKLTEQFTPANPETRFIDFETPDLPNWSWKAALLPKCPTAGRELTHSPKEPTVFVYLSLLQTCVLETERPIHGFQAFYRNGNQMIEGF
ncbi:MAG: hypothetical protein AAB214_00790, partial [Fibrobacterota bacterium]